MAALIWIPVPKENQPMANIGMGFDTATLLAVPLGYLLGGNPTIPKKPAPDDVQQMDVKADEVNVNDK